VGGGGGGPITENGITENRPRRIPLSLQCLRFLDFPIPGILSGPGETRFISIEFPRPCWNYTSKHKGFFFLTSPSCNCCGTSKSRLSGNQSSTLGAIRSGEGLVTASVRKRIERVEHSAVTTGFSAPKESHSLPPLPLLPLSLFLPAPMDSPLLLSMRLFIYLFISFLLGFKDGSLPV